MPRSGNIENIEKDYCILDYEELVIFDSIVPHVLNYSAHLVGARTTVKSEIKAAACIFILRFIVRLVYEGGL